MVAILIACATLVCRADTTILQAKQAGASSPSRQAPVVLRGVVTAFSGWQNSFFLQDKTGGISVDRLEQTALSVGDLVVVHGSLSAGLFAPIVISKSIDVVGRSGLPAAPEPTFEELDGGAYDGRRIQLTGVVHTAEITRVWGRQIMMIDLHISGGSLSVHVLNYAKLTASALVDSTITLEGVCGAKFNDRRQIIGLRLFVPGEADIKVDVAAADIFKMPKTNIAEMRQYPSGMLGHHRVRVEGVVTYQSSEHGLYLEDEGGAIHVQSMQRESFRPGQRVEAWGFVRNFGYSPGLEDAKLQLVGSGGQIQPQKVSTAEVLQMNNGFQSTRFDGRLIQVHATVVEQLPSRRDQLWLLRDENILFQAELSTESSANEVAFEPQSKITAVGVCVAEVDDNGYPTSFRLLLRSDRDITVARSLHWERSFLLLLTGFLVMLAAALAVGAFDHSYAAPVPARVGPQRQNIFKIMFAVLSWGVLGFAVVLLLAGTANWLLPDSRYGSRAIWVAMSAGALGAAWSTAEPRWKRSISLLCSIAICASGAITLWRYRTPPGAQQFDNILDVVNGPGFSVAVALCFCVLGVSLLLLRLKRALHLAQLSAVGVGALAMLNVVTRTYSASQSYAVARHVTMPPMVAGCFLALSAAVLVARPRAGVMGPIFSSTYGGLISRRLLPAALSIPMILGWFHLEGQRVGLYDSPFGLALFALANCFAFACMVWTSAAVLNRLDETRIDVEAKLRKRDRQFELLFEKTGIGDYTWDIAKDELTAHPVIWQLYGYEGGRTVGPSELFRQRQHPEDEAIISQAVLGALASRSSLEVEFRIIRPDDSIRWISCRANVICDEAGVPAYVNGLNMDVTERKRSEADLLESTTVARAIDKQFQMGLEFAQVASWRIILDKGELTWSGPVEAVFGAELADLSSYAKVRSMMDPDDAEIVDAATTKAAEEGTNFVIEYRFVKNGVVRWIAGRGGALRDESGRIYGLSGVNFDITATKVAEQRLLESESNFRELADAMPQIVWIANCEGKIEYYNQRWYEYSGSTAGQDISCFIQPDDFEAADRLWRESLKTGIPFACERRLRRAADQTYRWHLSRALPIRDGQGRICRWFGTSTDIDDYKRAQAEIQLLNADLKVRVEELADKELHYRMLFEGVKDYALFRLDVDGNVKSWNSGAEQLMGYTTAEVLGKHYSMFHTQDSVSAGAPEADLGYAISNGRFYEEGWRRRKDGTQFWASTVITSLHDTEGRLAGFCKIIRDMTEQRQSMRLLVAERQRAELANQAKSTFLASMSHEIRTPMNAILGMADLLSETKLDAIQKEYVDRFQRAGANLLTLINDILDLSRIESGHFELEEVAFDIEEVAHRSLDLVSQKTQKNHVNLAFRIAPEMKLNYVGDPNRLQQILVNLLGNAAKFTQEGEIVLTIGPHGDGVANHIQIHVSDTGIGIPPDKLSAIFNDFTQAESSTTRRFGGTGLGLGIAERLVKRMGGALTVQSVTGAGSTFTFDALFKEASARAGESAPALPGIRILIVDSNRTNRNIYEETLSAWGMRPQTTESASEAVAILTEALRAEDRFEMLIVDRFSADLDAFAALAAIRTIDGDLPVLLTAAEDHPGEAKRIMASGFAGYAVKPVRRSQLRAAIARTREATQATAPLAIANGNQSNHPAEGAAERKIKLLVADDSEDNQFLIDAYLKNTPYKPEFTSNGSLAVKRFKEEQFDLILMDVQMPIMDGLQATEAIRALEKAVNGSAIPIIALTANAMEDDIQRSRSAGCNAHLAKPISKQNLLKTLNDCRPVAQLKS